MVRADPGVWIAGLFLPGDPGLSVFWQRCGTALSPIGYLSARHLDLARVAGEKSLVSRMDIEVVGIESSSMRLARGWCLMQCSEHDVRQLVFVALSAFLLQRK
jgi:hypothetical protein